MAPSGIPFPGPNAPNGPFLDRFVAEMVTGHLDGHWMATGWPLDGHWMALDDHWMALDVHWMVLYAICPHSCSRVQLP